MIELVRVHRDAKGTTKWLEPALERIRAMSARFDGNADALVNDVWKLYAEKSFYLGLFVGLDDEQIVGHVLAFIREWDGRMVGWITQVENDRIAGRDLIDHVLVTLGNWVEEWNFSFKNHGIRIDDLLFCTPRMDDAWARHSGFIDYRSIKQRKIPTMVKG